MVAAVIDRDEAQLSFGGDYEPDDKFVKRALQTCQDRRESMLRKSSKPTSSLSSLPSHVV